MEPCTLLGNFMWSDISVTLIACMLFPIFLVSPGYLFAWFGNLLDFRNRRLITQLLIGVVTSVSILPAITFLIGRFLRVEIVNIILLAAFIIFLFLVFRKIRSQPVRLGRWEKAALVLTLAWLIIAVFSTVDLQTKGKLYFSVLANDNQTRIALTDAIARTGIPPANPHLYPGKPSPVSYFYFWMIIPALLTRLTGGWIDARISFIASTVWAGIALRALVVLYLRFHAPRRAGGIRYRSVAAVFLLFITGLDILFAAIEIYRLPGNVSITEWWNGNSLVSSWTGATLWAPHHIAGLVACLMGILVMQSIAPASTRQYKMVAAVIASLSLVSAFGLSLYVTFVFVIIWIGYLAFTILTKNLRYRTIWVMITGCLALLLAAPFLLDLIQGRQSFSTSGGGFLVFEVRSLWPLERALDGWNYSPAFIELANLVMLPINYFLELGFFLLAGLLYFSTLSREEKKQEWFKLDLLILSISFIISSFFRSTIIANNDLGWRGFMPVQFILLIWSAELFVMVWTKEFGEKRTQKIISITPFTKNFLWIVLLVGLSSNLFDLFYLRFFYWIDEKVGWIENMPAYPYRIWGERTYALREAFCFINDNFPSTAIVQNNPSVETLVLTQGLYGMRQTVVAGELYVFIYGDSLETYQKIAPTILPIFENPKITFEEVQNICSQQKIDVLVAKDLDPVWADKQSWLWKTSPVFSNSFSRIFDCGKN
jgi:hypothetical protein